MTGVMPGMTDRPDVVRNPSCAEPDLTEWVMAAPGGQLTGHVAHDER